VQRPYLPEASTIFPYLEAIDQDRWYTNRGRLAWQLEELLSEKFGCRSHQVISFASGTVALESAILAHAGQANAERPLALLPSYTFVATAHAAIRCGYRLHFADVDPQTWMLDPDAIAAHPQLSRAGLILSVAAYGRMPDMLGWERVQAATGVPVVIDAAASIERFLAAPGSVSEHLPAALSFHATKSFTTAEGGAVLWNDADALLRLAQISNFGMDDTRVCKLPGMNGKMSEYHAAVGLACLDQWPARAARHEAVAAEWSSATRHWPGHILTTPEVSATYVLFAARDAGTAEAVARALDAAGIDTRRWYGEALHRQPLLCGEAADPLPVTEDLASRHLGLPAAIDLTADEITTMAKAICPDTLANPYAGRAI
jgi:dTDP-4-amino-4,6-dideoxygalactose transaminase